MKFTRLQKNKLQDICRKLQIQLLVVHGSQNDNSVRRDSDIDLAYLVKKDTKTSILELYHELGEVFNSDKLDLSNLATANPLLLHEVAEHSQLLFGTQAQYRKFQLRAYHRHQDYAPYFKMEADLNRSVLGL